MAGLVNKETNKSVDALIASIDSESKREDSRILLQAMKDVTGNEPKIWGNNQFIGFGKYTYTRKHGKEEFEWFNVGFAPRKNKITVYLTFDIEKEPLIKDLGKCKHGKGCLYINKLDDVDMNVLKKLIDKSKDATWH